MNNVIAVVLFVLLAVPCFTSIASAESLKQKCNSHYRTCLDECKKIHSHGKDVFKCQGECGKKKMDCKKSASQGKKFSWKAEK